MQRDWFAEVNIHAMACGCLLSAALCVAFAPCCAAETSYRMPPSTFNFNSMCAIAEQKLAVPFSRKVYDLPCELVGLDYDSWRYIAYQAERTLWRPEDFPFQIETGHRGYLFSQRVQLNEVAPNSVSEIAFNPLAFEYRNWLHGFRFPRTLGHSGWKLLGRFNDDRAEAAATAGEVYVRELASFMGASYFRVLGSEHVYGSSLRGLAVDCAMPHPEEFPVFTQYWLQRPSAESSTFRFWALLESERVVGAYQFDICPNKETTVDVRAKLFVRGKIEKLGIAPITSMWMWGGGTPPPTDDPRPQVHDADGLTVIGTDNNQLWRPLSRPDVPVVNHYSVPGLIAFGLMQRDRNAASYADNEAKYERRPSIFIEPKTAWPAGAVELLRLPAQHEGIDNIAAFYLLDQPPGEGESFETQYRIHICDDRDVRSLNQLKTSRKVARFEHSEVRQIEAGKWSFRLTAASSNTELDAIDENKLEAGLMNLWLQLGHLSDQKIKKTPAGIEVSFNVNVASNEAFDLQLSLRDSGRDLTEMWSYRCEP